MTDFNPEIQDSYATTTVNRMLSDLTPLLDSRRGQRMVLGGDLNVGDQWREGTRFARWGPMHSVTMDRFEALGLTDCLRMMVPADRGPLENCPCGPRDDCKHVRTQRHGNKPDGPPFETDYFFVGRALVESVAECQPREDEDAWSLSDHCPVVLTLDLAPTTSKGGCHDEVFLAHWCCRSEVGNLDLGARSARRPARPDSSKPVRLKISDVHRPVSGRF